VRLVVLYGPPGVGKLTTANALAGLTHFKNFHNHLSFDLAKAIFAFPSPAFLQLMETVRLSSFEAAARERVPGLVFTFVYATPEDDGFVRRTIDVVESHGGKLAFVRLYCDAATNERRVVGEDRRRFGKITTVDALRRMLASGKLGAVVPFRDSLEIDTSSMEPDAVARRIVRHFSLPTAVESS
jgi:chloramphenicol 3-O-phosphotransferase